MPNHLISLDTLSAAAIHQLLNEAKQFIDPDGLLRFPPAHLAQKTVALLFFENSTRTRCSFELAATRLGATVLQLTPQTASLQKGESLLDTLQTLAAMSVDAFVIRHPENGLPQWIVDTLAPNFAVINAGDGCHAHPTQALLDLFTLLQHKPAIEPLRVAFLGDIRHSRVARSLTGALLTLGARDIRYIGPAALLPDPNTLPSVVCCYENAAEGLEGADVVVTLRLQYERFSPDTPLPCAEAYAATYGLTPERFACAKPDAIVMHPGPINRGVEIAASVADGPHSVVLEQARNGVAVRMAVLLRALGPYASG